MIKCNDDYQILFQRNDYFIKIQEDFCVLQNYMRLFFCLNKTKRFSDSKYL